MSLHPCCLKGFTWNGTPKGKIGKLADNEAYIAGNSSKRAILYVHDALGWDWTNARLLADHFAAEVDATVYVPDFYHGFHPTEKDVNIYVGDDGEAKLEFTSDFDVKEFFTKNSPDARLPEILACAKELKKKYAFLGAVGYCWGGGVGFKIAAKEHGKLFDCVTIAHPGTPSDDDIRNLSVPVQILSPEHDPTFTQERKDFCLKEIPKLGIDFLYNYFPGVVHGFATKGDPENEVQKRALERAKNAVVQWCLQYASAKEQ